MTLPYTQASPHAKRPARRWKQTMPGLSSLRRAIHPRDRHPADPGFSHPHPPPWSCCRHVSGHLGTGNLSPARASRQRTVGNAVRGKNVGTRPVVIWWMSMFQPSPAVPGRGLLESGIWNCSCLAASPEDGAASCHARILLASVPFLEGTPPVPRLLHLVVCYIYYESTIAAARLGRPARRGPRE